MKKIGLNLLYIIPNKVGGTQTYAEGILDNINYFDNDFEFHVFCSIEYFKVLQKKKLNCKIHPININNHNRILRILYENFILPFLVKKYNLNVLHSLGYTAPLFVPAKNIVTIHDLNWFYQKESFSYISRIVWAVLVTLSAKTSNLILTDSKSSKKSINQVLKISDKVRVVYPGVTTYKKNTKNLKKINQKIKKKYILTVSSLLPHKNIYRLLKAFKNLLNEENDLQLLIVGLGGKDHKKIIDYINANFKIDSILILGWISNEQLAALYSNATAFIFPSLYEGFGFPVLEAFKYNTPVISSECYSLKELTKGAVAVIDPYSIKNIEEVTKKVISNKSLQLKLMGMGQKQVKNFSWEETVKNLYTIYNE